MACEILVLGAHGSDRERWRDVLRRFSRNDVYYTPEYACAYEGFADGVASAFVLVDGGNAVIHPVMIRKLSALPFASEVEGVDRLCDMITPYGYGGPLASASDPSKRDALLATFESLYPEHARSVGAVSEFVRFHPLLATHDGMRGRMDLTRRGETVWLEIFDDEERMMAAMTPACRNKVRRARKEGVTVSAESGPEAISALTTLYHETLDRLVAPRSYYFPAEYFERIAALPGDASEILIARKDGRPLWAGVFMREGEFLHYHLSGTAGGDRTPGVNNLALLEAGLRGAARGAKTFHLGGGFGSREDSLFTFKAGFGNRRAEFWTGQRVIDPVAYERLCAARRELIGATPAADGTFFPEYRAP